jgi:hypothetical protein
MFRGEFLKRYLSELVVLILFVAVSADCSEEESSVASSGMMEHNTISLVKQIWGNEFSVKFRDEDVSFLEYQKNGERIDLTLIDNIDKTVAEEFIDDKISLFKSMFQRQRTGYPGQQTVYIECPEKFKPKYSEKQVSGGYFKYFTGFANANFVAGAPAEDLVKYHHIYGLLYCHSQKCVLEIRYFIPLEKEMKKDLFIKGVNCDIRE